MESIAIENRLKLSKAFGGDKISIPDFLRFCEKNGITPDMNKVRGNDKNRAASNGTYI